MIDTMLDKSFKIYFGEDKEIKITIVGFAYKQHDEESVMYTEEMYVTDSLMATMLKETYSSGSTIKVTLNGKVQEHQQG